MSSDDDGSECCHTIYLVTFHLQFINIYHVLVHLADFCLPSCPAAQIVNFYILTMAGFRSLAPKTRNLVVAGGLSAFVLGVYYYTMRAVGGTDELQVAIDKFEEMKKKDAARNSNAGGS